MPSIALGLFAVSAPTMTDRIAELPAKEAEQWDTLTAKALLCPEHEGEGSQWAEEHVFRNSEYWHLLHRKTLDGMLHESAVTPVSSPPQGSDLQTFERRVIDDRCYEKMTDIQDLAEMQDFDLQAFLDGEYDDELMTVGYTSFDADTEMTDVNGRRDSVLIDHGHDINPAEVFQVVEKGSNAGKRNSDQGGEDIGTGHCDLGNVQKQVRLSSTNESAALPKKAYEIPKKFSASDGIQDTVLVDLAHDDAEDFEGIEGKEECGKGSEDRAQEGLEAKSAIRAVEGLEQDEKQVSRVVPKQTTTTAPSASAFPIAALPAATHTQPAKGTSRSAPLPRGAWDIPRVALNELKRSDGDFNLNGVGSNIRCARVLKALYPDKFPVDIARLAGLIGAQWSERDWDNKKHWVRIRAMEQRDEQIRSDMRQAIRATGLVT